LAVLYQPDAQKQTPEHCYYTSPGSYEVDFYTVTWRRSAATFW